QPGKLFGNGDSGSTTWLTRAANASTRGSSRWADAYVSRPTAPSTNAEAIENARLNCASYELRGRRLVSAGSQMIGTSPAGTRHSAAGEPSGERARVAGPTRMQPLDPRPVLEVLHDAGGEAAGETERRRQPCGVQPLACAGGERGSEGAAHRRGVPAAGVER